jgi:antitoxin StbD
MENLRATRSVSITELKRSPSAVLAEANFEPVAVLNHNKPAAYLLPAATYEAMLDKLEIDFIRNAIQLGRDSGASIPADLVFAELEARYADGTHAKDA